MVREVSIEGLRSARSAGAVVVDVRESEEYEAGHVPGAWLVPLSRLGDRVAEVPKDRPVYVVCASGNRSSRAAAWLDSAGVDAYSVAGGTQAWTEAGHPVVQGSDEDSAVSTARSMGGGDVVEIAVVETPTLGDRSYLVSDGVVAFVVDPQRDIDRMLALAEERGVRITDVFETHMHNDYLTGGLALARAVGASYHVNSADTVSFERTPVTDGDVVAVGATMRVRVLATPGHTHTHLSYVLETPGRAPAVFTGGSLLYGSTGRPDLLGADQTEGLAHDQYASARRLAGDLPDEAEIYPTHGFGSFCSATQAHGDSSTIGDEKQHNPALTRSESNYVRELLAGLDDYPAYYVHMQPGNAAGPAAPDLSLPQRAGATEIRRSMEAGEWVVDLRNRTAFAAGHVPGTLNFGIDGGLATYLGWLIPWGTPLTLLGDSPEQVAEAQRELVRIGLDDFAGQATGDPRQWAGATGPRTLPRADFAQLAQVCHHRPVIVLDVRRNQEWDSGHIEGAIHVPLHELLDRADEIPHGEVWVHCQSGYRASIAASILAAAGRQVVAIDDDYANTAALHEELAPATT